MGWKCLLHHGTKSGLFGSTDYLFSGDPDAYLHHGLELRPLSSRAQLYLRRNRELLHRLDCSGLPGFLVNLLTRDSDTPALPSRGYL
jgi:hypothetical protein